MSQIPCPTCDGRMESHPDIDYERCVNCGFTVSGITMGVVERFLAASVRRSVSCYVRPGFLKFPALPKKFERAACLNEAPVPKKCECGWEKTGIPGHAEYCPKHGS